MSPRNLLVNTATVTPSNISTATDGSGVRTGGTSYSLTCSIQPRGSSESLDMGGDNGKVHAVMYYLAVESIGMEDTVTYSGRTYRVVGPERDVASRGVMKMVDLESESVTSG